MNDKEKFEDLMNRLYEIKSILKTHKEKLEAIEEIVYDIKHVNNIGYENTMAKFQRFRIDKIEKILHED